MSYSIAEHSHRFALWTAARAVQRSFTTTSVISHAINNSGLRKFAESAETIDQPAYDRLHSLWANEIKTAFKTNNIEASYGRSAKIIAVYLKTRLIIGTTHSPKHDLIHPPIDRVLLTELSKQKKDAFYLEKNWTELSEPEYWNLARKIRQDFNCFDWRLEKYWNLDNAKTSKA